MAEELGLRERKKLQTRRVISRAAMELFAARGFDAVTVAEVAAAAEVSVKTVFNYFPTKEDLVLEFREQLDLQLIRTIRERPEGESILSAVRRHTLEFAEHIRNAPPERHEIFRKVIHSAPTVKARWNELHRRREEELAKVLAEETGADASDDVEPHIAASVLVRAARLAFCDIPGWPEAKRRSRAGMADDINRAFDLLENGLGSYGVRAKARAAARRK